MRNKKKLILFIATPFALACILLIFLLNIHNSQENKKITKNEILGDNPGTDFNNFSEQKDEIVKRLNYLDRMLCRPEDNNSDLIMQNPEWALFSYSFTTFAITNILKQDSTIKTRYVPMMRIIIEKTLKSNLSSKFGIDDVYALDTDYHNYSVLYLGHVNLMIGCYKMISKDTSFNQLNDIISKSLHNGFSNSDFMNLESYPGSIWISDNTVALASLNLHSKNTGSNYNEICAKWIVLMKNKYTDQTTNLLFSTIDPITGYPLEEPRGSMLGWDIIFISKFDKNYAIELYNNYCIHFSDNHGKFRLFRERHENYDTGYGDIDSGPLLNGYSIPANVFAMAGAVIGQDYTTAKQINRLINIGGNKIKNNNEIYYNPKLLDMEISPMAEGIVLFSITMNDWNTLE